MSGDRLGGEPSPLRSISRARGLLCGKSDTVQAQKGKSVHYDSVYRGAFCWQPAPTAGIIIPSDPKRTGRSPHVVAIRHVRAIGRSAAVARLRARQRCSAAAASARSGAPPVPAVSMSPSSSCASKAKRATSNAVPWRRSRAFGTRTCCPSAKLTECWLRYPPSRQARCGESSHEHAAKRGGHRVRL